MSGWIKLHRSIRSHWINEVNRPRTYREAWEDILLSVNWEPKKVLVRGDLIDCQPGQSLNSLQTWAKEFNWTIAKVRHFFKLLEKDGIVTLEGLQYTTRLTICKWEDYQAEATDEKHAKQQTERKPKTSTKEDKEYKERIKGIFGVFRNAYPGEKRGLEVEFKNFIEKNTPDTVHLLLPALQKELNYKGQAKAQGEFVASWKHLKTWVNQKCWTQEFPKLNGTSLTQNISPEPKFKSLHHGQENR